MSRSTPYITSTTHTLPFDRLSPADFERLCLWLVEQEGYHRAEHLGLAGTEQGRDVTAYKATDRGEEVWYFQCKRYRSIRAAVLKAEVDNYLQLAEEDAALRPVGVVFVVSSALSAAIRRDVAACCIDNGLECEFWALTELDMRVKRHPDLLSEFFGWQVEPTLTAEERHEEERRYLARVAEECRYLYTEGVDRVRAELTDVFVMLEAVASLDPEKQADGALVPTGAEERGLEKQSALPKSHEEQQKTDQLSAPVPLSRVLHEHSHLMILGEPGTGKTTTMQFIALCFATGGGANGPLSLAESRVPVLLKAREYDGTGRLDDFLVRQLYQAYVPETLAQCWLAEGRLAILLDGFDEVPWKHRAAVANGIERFAVAPVGQRCRIVVTSRVVGYRTTRDLGHDFGLYTICPLKETKDLTSYIAGWLRVLQPRDDPSLEEQARILIQEFEQRGLDRVMGNPLLLRLALAVYTETGELVRSRTTLYERYIAEVAWKRAKVREEPRWNIKQIQQTLETVAWALQFQEDQTMSALGRVVEQQVDSADDASGLIDYLCEQLGILAVYQYQHGAQVAFRHLTFREYFVAMRLRQAWKADEKRTWRFLHPRLHHPSWREPILLLAGMLNEPEAKTLTRLILNASSHGERELHRDLLLVATILAEGVPVDAVLFEQVVETLLALFVDTEVKLPAILPLSPARLGRGRGRKHKQALPWQIKHFFRPNWSKRLLTVHWLVRAFMESAITAVSSRLRVWLQSSSGHGRYRLLQERVDAALVEIGRRSSEPIVQELSRFLVDESSDGDGERENLAEGSDLDFYSTTGQDVHQRAADILGNLGAADVLVRALANREGRLPAARAFLKIKRKERVSDLLLQEGESPSASIREAVAWILSIEDGSRAASLLLRLAQDSDNMVRFRALTSLGSPSSYPWAQKALVVLLTALADGGQHRETQRAAIDALFQGVLRCKGRYGYMAMVHIDAVQIDLVHAVAEHHVHLLETIEALREEGPNSEKALEILTRLSMSWGAGGNPSDLQEISIGFLGVLGTGRAEKLNSLVDLLLALNKKWPYKPVAPGNAIVKLAESMPHEIVSNLLEKGEADILRQLAEADSPGAIPALCVLLQSENGDVRLLAAEALEKIVPPAFPAVESLRQLLADESDEIREAATWALAKLGIEVETTRLYLGRHVRGEVPYYSRTDGAAHLLWNLGVDSPEVVKVLLEWCVIYWADYRDSAMQLLPRLLEVAPEVVESDLIEVLRHDQQSTTDRLGSRPKDRARAAEMMGYLGLGSPSAKKALADALSDLEGATVNATWALGKLGQDSPDVELVKTWVEILQERRSLIRNARKGSTSLPFQPFYDARMTELDLFPALTEAAVLALGYQGRTLPEAKQTMLAIMAEDENTNIQSAAAIALARLDVFLPEILDHLLDVWGNRNYRSTFYLMRMDAWDSMIQTFGKWANEEPSHIFPVLVAATERGSSKALDIMFEYFDKATNERILLRLAKALQRRLATMTDVDDIAYDVTYNDLDRVTSKLTEATVSALGDGPSLFITERSRGQRLPNWNRHQAKDHS